MEFEPQIRLYVKQLIDQWGTLFDRALKGESDPQGEGWVGRDGRLWLDCLPCRSSLDDISSRLIV